MKILETLWPVGLKRLFSSSKGMAAMMAIQVMAFMWLGVDKITAATFATNLTVVVGLYMGTTAAEDISTKLKEKGGK